MSSKPAMLIALPTGLTVGGVQVFAARLANALAARGRCVGLLLHPARGPALDSALDPSVNVFQLPDSAGDGPVLDAARCLPHYQRAVFDLHAKTGRPVVCAPNHLGDCYGLFATQARRYPERMRVAGWCHSAIPYDARVLEYYEPLLTRLVAVSDELESRLRAKLPARGAEIRNIPCGVEVGPARAFAGNAAARPLRLMYVGRLEDDIKRVSVLAHLSEELSRRGVAHALTVVGDGPAAAAFEQAPEAVTLIKNAGPARISRLLEDHDIFVLPSRVEGLSLSMLEAMGRGCVPIVTRTESGAAQVLEGKGGPCGVIVDPPVGAGFASIAAAMAEAVVRARPRLAELSAAAQRAVGERYSLARHVSEVEQLIDEAAADVPRRWPADRQPMFTAHDPKRGSGAVPPEGPILLRELLESLAGRRIVLHGAGRHTAELAGVIGEYRDRVVAITDDDPSRHGQTMDSLPILSPAAAGSTGATDVVISSWMNQEQIWQGRGTYERQRIRVHRIYPVAA